MNQYWEWLISPIYKRKLRKLTIRVEYIEMMLEAMLQEPNSAEIEKWALNGQRQRKEIFYAIMEKGGFDSIIETGTFLGVTTWHMAEKTKLPVFSSENNRRFHLLAKKRLAHMKNVHLSLSDSRDLLKSLGEGPEKPKKPFIYLDAHWSKDLPLAEELEIISKHWPECVIMIDDFEVPGDNGFKYDDYGWGNALNMRTFSKTFSKLGFVPFSPSKSSSTETGSLSGCVLLAKKDGKMSELLGGIDQLRKT
jgi:predicted O-methyltransferase YrrM